MTNVTLDEGWVAKGRIELSSGKLTAPDDIPDQPGLYCLVFEERTRYYGEAGDLRRRIGDYLSYYAGVGIESELRINKALHAHNGADIFVVVGDGLQSRSQRCTIENRLVREAKQRDGWTVLNGGTIPDRIAFHAAEIIRLTAKLAVEPKNDGASRQAP